MARPTCRLGYGDISPLDQPAYSLTWTGVLLGQFYFRGCPWTAAVEGQRLSPMHRRWFALLGGLCLALAACAGPLGTARVDPKTVLRNLGRSAVATGVKAR